MSHLDGLNKAYWQRIKYSKQYYYRKFAQKYSDSKSATFANGKENIWGRMKAAWTDMMKILINVLKMEKECHTWISFLEYMSLRNLEG